MKINTASQAIGAQMCSATDGSEFTGTVTVYVTGDAGTQAIGSVGSGICTHEGHGYHTYAPAQAETNYALIAFTFIGSGAIPATVQVYTTFPQTGDNFARLGAPAGASVSADIAAAKVDTAAIKVKTDFLPSATAGATGGVFIAGTNAATTITTGLTTNITGNLSGSVGSVTGNVGGTVATVTNLTNAPTSGDFTATMKTSIATAVAASAVASVTGNVGGNVTGSVGSVVGAVGSVTGAVGSVTGNVGGNVTGSVGSLAAQAKADVNAEALDVLNVDTYAEPAQGAPPATASIAAKVGWLMKAWRNRSTQTASQYSLYNDDATTVDHKATFSDNGTTADRGEMATGP